MKFIIMNNSKSDSIQMNYYGFAYPLKEEDILPNLRVFLSHVIKRIKNNKEDMKFIDLEETLNLLETIYSLTEVEKGYIHFKPENDNENRT